MSSSKAFEGESPFLQGESILTAPEVEPEHDFRHIESPFLSFDGAHGELNEFVDSIDAETTDDGEVDEENSDTETWPVEAEEIERPAEERYLELLEASPGWVNEEETPHWADIDEIEEREQDEEEEDGPSYDQDIDADTEAETLDAEVLGNSGRQIILVAGIEFPRYSKHPVSITGKSGKWWRLSGGRVTPERNAKTGSHWRQKCLGLAAQKLKEDPTLIVHLYDFDRATRETVKLVKGKVETMISHNFPPLVAGDYRWIDGDFSKPETILLKSIDSQPISVTKLKERPFIRFCPAVSQMSGDVKQQDWIARFSGSAWGEHGLSIRAVYEHIEQIGTQQPYTLQEFHSFGHASSSTYGYRSGTAFVNTTHIGSATDKRHPLDFDARAGLDFKPTTINVKNFRMAFALGAMSYVWGCNWDVPVFRLINALTKSLGSKTLTADVELPFHWAGEKSEFESLMKPVACAAAGWKNDKTKKVELRGKCVREFFTILLNDTYMQQLANASAHCVTGGLSGTWSDYDNIRENGAPLLSHIPMGGLYCKATAKERCTQDLRRVLKFYAKQFSRAFNKDGAHPDFGRGYALFCPALVP